MNQIEKKKTIKWENGQNTWKTISQKCSNFPKHMKTCFNLIRNQKCKSTSKSDGTMHSSEWLKWKRWTVPILMRTLLLCSFGYKIIQLIWKIAWQNFLVIWSAISFTCLTEMYVDRHQQTHSRRSAAGLIVVALNWRQPTCPSTVEWMHILWYKNTGRHCAPVWVNDC